MKRKLPLILQLVIICFSQHVMAQPGAISDGRSIAFSPAKVASEQQRTLGLKDALRELESRYKVSFFYKPKYVENKMVLITKTEKQSYSFEEELGEILKTTGLKYDKIQDKSYVLSPVEEGQEETIPSVKKKSFLPEASPINHSFGFQKTASLNLEDITITGKVVSDEGETLPGVSVFLKGATSTGTITDGEGNYKITVPNGTGILVFSYIGFVTEEIVINNRTVINTTLTLDVQSLEEVVVVGYGTQKKKDLTAAVSSLSGEVLQKVPVASLGEALTGRMPGVRITTTEGSPDAEIKIRVRGGGSISQDNSPLYIVDGFPVNSISNIPPTDIESIDVLKDASATSIYGARGANGVIIVTTKGGRDGKISVDLNAYVGQRNMVNPIEVLNPYEYVRYQHELDQTETFNNYYGAFDDLEIYKSVRGRNWVNEVFGRSALVQNYNLGISGGSKALIYSVNFTRNDEESIMIGSSFERNSLNLKLKSDLSKKITIDFNNRLNLSYIDGAGVSSGAGANTRLRNSVKYPPTLGLREFSDATADEDNTNSPETASLLYDPVFSTYDEYKKQNQLSNNTNVALNYKAFSFLTFRSEWGYEFGKNRTDYVWGPSTSTSKNNGGQPVAQIGYAESSGWRNANTLTFSKSNIFEGHDLTVLLGNELLVKSGNTLTSESRLFPVNMKVSEVLAVMDFGTAPQKTVTKIAADNNLASVFGRINYSIKGKYLFQATYRIDGSSAFAPGKQFGYFPSASIGWRVSEENFLKNIQQLSNLKLRVSYGAAGNNRIPLGTWRGSYSASNDNSPVFFNEIEASQLVPPNVLDNPDLKWETTYTRNLGLDWGVFQNRISGTLDLYWNTTKDLLIAAPLPSASGRSIQYQNIGQTSNKGVELSMEAVLVQRRDFNISANFNINYNTNKVEKFSNGDSNFKTYTSGWNGSAQPLDDYLIREGEPVGMMYGYVTDGMYTFDDFTYNTTKQIWEINEGVVSSVSQTSSLIGPGMLKLKDINGDGVLNADDKTVIGNANPLHTGGFGVNASYKGFDLAGFFNWSYGNEIYNANKIDYSTQLLSRKYQNLIGEMSLDHRFTIIDPATGRNVYNGQYGDPERLKEINQNATIWSPIMTLTPLHSWAIEDGSFLRVNNISVGYTIPSELSKKIGISRFRLYVSGYNLHTFTKYSGFDPEVDTRRSTPLTPGVDYSAYPRSRSFLTGINVTF